MKTSISLGLIVCVALQVASAHAATPPKKVKYPSANNTTTSTNNVLGKFGQKAPFKVLGNFNGENVPERGHGPVVKNPPFTITHGGNPPRAPQPTGTCDSGKSCHHHCDNWFWYVNTCYGNCYSDCYDNCDGCYDYDCGNYCW